MFGSAKAISIPDRSIWRVVAAFPPLAYHAPLAGWALVLIGPVALLAANALAAWPQRRAMRLRAGQVLRNRLTPTWPPPLPAGGTGWRRSHRHVVSAASCVSKAWSGNA